MTKLFGDGRKGKKGSRAGERELAEDERFY